MSTPAFYMLDIETLGTKPGCPVVQIAVTYMPALAADEPIPEGLDAYFTNVIPEDVRYYSIEPDTIQFWMKQLFDGKQPFKGNDSTRESHVEHELANWCREHPADIWMSRGSGFDFPITENVFNVHNQKAPWSFWQICCTRSFQMMAELIGLKWEKPAQAHNALNDALCESMNVVRLLRKMQSDPIPYPAAGVVTALAHEARDRASIRRLDLGASHLVEEKGTHTLGTATNPFPENTDGQEESNQEES